MAGLLRGLPHGRHGQGLAERVLPFGQDQSSYLGRWTRSTSSPSRARRQQSTPAASSGFTSGGPPGAADAWR